MITSPDTIILLIVEYHAAIGGGGKNTRAPVAYAPGVLVVATNFFVAYTTAVNGPFFV